MNPAMLMDQLVEGDGRLVNLRRRLKRCERRYDEIRREAELVMLCAWMVRPCSWPLSAPRLAEGAKW